MNQSRKTLTQHLRLVSVGTLVSRVLGMVRDTAMAASFGNGPILDAFTVAFRLPNLARVLFGEGALTTAFLPVFLRDREHSAQQAASLLWSLFLAQGVFLGLLIGLGELILWGCLAVLPLSSDGILLIQLTAILLPYVGLICGAALLAAALHGLGYFGVPTLIPIVFNALWLMALFTILHFVETPVGRVLMLAGALVGAGVVQMAIPLPLIIQSGLGFRLAAGPNWARLREIASHMIPVVIGLSITQINTIANSLIAWGFSAPSNLPEVDAGYPLTSGTASALYFGQRLYQFPLGVFGVALGTVIYPQLTRHALKADFQRLGQDLGMGLRLVAAIGIPASAGLCVLSFPLTRGLFEYGAFTSQDTVQTAQMVAAYGCGVWAFCGLLIIQRAFYAIGDRQTPLRIGVLGALVNLTLNLILIHVIGGIALAASTTVIGVAQFLATLAVWPKEKGQIPWLDVRRSLIKCLIATALMSLTCWGALLALEDVAFPGARLWNVVIPVVASIVVYFGVARLIGLQEPWWLITRRSQTAESGILPKVVEKLE